ncbi:hypothetical protein L6V77_06555 [Myxococcota bacterium]|nr:hypothetical protein [Myxococcota bacterium]
MTLRRPAPLRLARAATLLVVAGALGCGARPAPAPEPSTRPRPAPATRDVFHDVYLRGGTAAAGAPPRVALTLDGLGACAGPLLSRLRAPTEGAAPMPATFFLAPAELEVERAAAPEVTTAALRRLAAEGHGVGLAVRALPATWRQTPADFRAGLAGEGRRLASSLAAGEGPMPPAPLVWRGPVDEGALIGWGAVVDRPQVYWSVYVDLERSSAASIEAQIVATARDGDILHLALPSATSGPSACAAVDSVPALARGLEAAGLTVVPLHALLAPELGRYEVARLARYDGPGLSAPCRAALGLPPPGPGDAVAERRPRYGLRVGDLGGQTRVLPLPGTAGSLPGLLSGEREAALALWARRGEWRALPACVVPVDEARQLSPLTPDGRLYVVGPEGVARRDARALGAPERPAVLPTRADLVRLEARQRLPWRLRGLVAQTLAGLSLDTPLLVEARSSVALVVGAHLTPDAGRDPATLQGAIAGYVQLSELSLGEYLFLARLFPADADVLARAARAAEGFLRPGPHLVLRGGAGEAPSPARLGVTGGPDAPFDPVGLLARALSAGVSLSPGDVLAAAPIPPFGGPPATAGQGAGTGRGAVRRLLAGSVLRGATSPTFLRPGTPVQAEGDLLGAVEYRVVVPPGVQLPETGTRLGAHGPGTEAP